MPDYRQSNLISMRKREGRNLAEIRATSISLKEQRRIKGKLDAREAINDIYNVKLFQMLNNTAKGVAGARGRRKADIAERDKNLVVARALEEHHRQYSTLPASPRADMIP